MAVAMYRPKGSFSSIDITIDHCRYKKKSLKYAMECFIYWFHNMLTHQFQNGSDLFLLNSDIHET